MPLTSVARLAAFFVPWRSRRRFCSLVSIGTAIIVSGHVREGWVGRRPIFFFLSVGSLLFGDADAFRPWSAPVEGCRHARTPGAEVHRLLGKGCLMALVLVDDGSTDDVESTALEIQYRYAVAVGIPHVVTQDALAVAPGR